MPLIDREVRLDEVAGRRAKPGIPALKPLTALTNARPPTATFEKDMKTRNIQGWRGILDIYK
jgi:hypothetical protein